MNRPKSRQEIRTALKDARYHIGATVVFFLAGILVGFEQPDFLRSSFQYLVELASFLKDRSVLVIVLFLISKNALASLIVLWAGTLLGVVPLLAAVQNGVLIGAVFSRQESVFLSFLNILPHGIFELPAFFLACGIGAWRGTWLFRRDRREPYKERARKGYLVFFRLILPLLIIAAVIEGVRIAAASGGLGRTL